MPVIRGRWSLALLAVLACLPAILHAQSSPPVVDVAHPQPLQVAGKLQLTGTVTTAWDAALSPQVAGLVERMAVDAGDAVKQGQVLVKLDARLAELGLKREDAALAEARTQLSEARRLRDESERLSGQGSLPKSQFETRRAEAELAAAAVARLEAQRAEQAERVARHSLRAPFDGVIRRRLAAPGEWVQGGTVVLELVSTAGRRVDIQVPQSSFGALREGQTATVRIDALPDRELSARVAARVPAADPASRSFLARVELEQTPDEVVPGMSAQVTIDLSRTQASLALPAGAIKRFPDGSQMAWVVDPESRAQRVRVQVQAHERGVVRVIEGLSATDRVIVSSHDGLEPGLQVKPRVAP